MARNDHRFGGSWREEKLDRVANYLQAYTTALKNQPFELLYIDAFAGTGYRASRTPGETVRGFFPLTRLTELARGSAHRAMEVEPPFDHYVFIEANTGRFSQLGTLEEEFAERKRRMHFRKQEANAAIIEICRTTSWKSTRAVLILTACKSTGRP